MTEKTQTTGSVDISTMLLIVVGAHLRAEVAHRPLAYGLGEWVRRWQHRHLPGEDVEPLEPVVCSDLWYLNDRDLLVQPSVVIGEPGVNAAAAYFANRLPTALVVDELLEIRLDLEFVDRNVCVWGVGEPGARRGVDLFTERYGPAFMRSIHGLRPEPG